jgi:hypothetical protein
MQSTTNKNGTISAGTGGALGGGGASGTSAPRISFKRRNKQKRKMAQILQFYYTSKSQLVITITNNNKPFEF